MELSPESRETFSAIRDRLEEISNQVRGDDVPLDAALDLYDEAVKLGMRATELLEAFDPSELSAEGEASAAAAAPSGASDSPAVDAAGAGESAASAAENRAG